jgi:hypothetical protein
MERDVEPVPFSGSRSHPVRSQFCDCNLTGQVEFEADRYNAHLRTQTGVRGLLRFRTETLEIHEQQFCPLSPLQPYAETVCPAVQRR